MCIYLQKTKTLWLLYIAPYILRLIRFRLRNFKVPNSLPFLPPTRSLYYYTISIYLSISIYHLSLVWSLPLHLALTVPRLTHNLLHIIPGHSSAVKDTPVSGSATGVCHGGHHLHGGSCPGRLWRRCSCSRPAGTRWLCHRRRVSFPVAATPRNRHNLTPVNPNNSSDICSKPIRLNINQNVK